MRVCYKSLSNINYFVVLNTIQIAVVIDIFKSEKEDSMESVRQHSSYNKENKNNNIKWRLITTNNPPHLVFSIESK